MNTDMCLHQQCRDCQDRQQVHNFDYEGDAITEFTIRQPYKNGRVERSCKISKRRHLVLGVSITTTTVQRRNALD